MRERIADAVRVVLRRDHGHLFAVIAVAFEVGRSDLAEDAGETFRALFLAPVAAAQENVRDHPRRHGRHFFGADGERNAAASALDEVQRAVDRRGTGRACILEMGRRRKAQAGNPKGHEPALEALRRESVVEDTDRDGVDILRVDLSMRQGRTRHTGNQGLDIGIIEFAERGVGPTHDHCALGHETCLLQ
ncbi:hypothetical protein D3C71_1230190 [compost metagenome]